MVYTTKSHKNIPDLVRGEKIIIGLIGRPGVGKDTVAKIIASVSRKKTDTFSFSKILIEEYCAHLGIEPTHPNLQYVGDAIRPSWLHDRARRSIEESDAEIIIIPSVRRIQDFEFIQSFKTHKLIGVVTDERKAFERMKLRKEKPGEEHLTWESYQALRIAPIDAEVGTLLEKAEVTIHNDGDLEDLTKQITQIFSDV